MEMRMRRPGGIEQMRGIPIDGRRYDRSNHHHEAQDQFAQFVSIHQVLPVKTLFSKWLNAIRPGRSVPRLAQAPALTPE
jgi:hypothetical protein